MQKRDLLLRVAAVCLAASVSPLRAAVIFTNITGPNTGLEAALGSAVPSGGPQSVAVAFTPAVNSVMNQAQVFAQAAGGDPAFNLFVYSNSGGAPGSSLETLGTDVTPVMFPTPAALVAVSGFTPLALTAGTEYWLVMTPFGPATKIAWTTGGSPSAQTDLSPTQNGTAPWSALALGSTTSVQFEIDGTPAPSVPEPGVTGLLAAGLGVIALTLRRRQPSGRNS